MAETKAVKPDGQLTCTFPGCEASMSNDNSAWVPSLSVLRQSNGGERPRTRENLLPHVLCGKHAQQARESGFRTYRLAGTLDQLERLAAEVENAGKYFSQMYSAFGKAGLVHRER
jgi:hypothetical protein